MIIGDAVYSADVVCTSPNSSRCSASGPGAHE